MHIDKDLTSPLLPSPLLSSPLLPFLLPFTSPLIPSHPFPFFFLLLVVRATKGGELIADDKNLVKGTGKMAPYKKLHKASQGEYWINRNKDVDRKIQQL